MSYGWPILSTVTFLPLLGALLIVAAARAATRAPSATRASSRSGPR